MKASSIPSEVLLKKGLSLDQRLAEQIIKNGIDCNAMLDLDFLQLERRSYYSYIFSMGPEIVTSRGCIRLEGKNVD